MLHSPIVYVPPDRPLVDLRTAVLRRRIKAAPAVADLLAELAYGDHDGLPAALRIAPTTEATR